MKRNISYLLIFIISILNLKCLNDFEIDLSLKPIDYTGETATIKVKEYKTNLPVSGAKFSTYYCKEYDFEFGNCIASSITPLSSCTTNNNGNCNCVFPNKSFHHINIEKSKYWSKHYHDIESNNEYIIQPEAWVDVNFKTNTTYPSTSTFSIIINGELNYVNDFVSATNNSNKVLRLYGNEENKISWTLYSNSQILNSGNFILYPNKFENLTYTLNY